MLRTLVFKILQIGAVVLPVLAFTVSTAGAQPAQAAPSARVSAGWMPFAGSLYDDQTNSNINLHGLVHIVAHWKTLSSGELQFDITVNLPAAGVTVTTDTGIPYIALGAGQSSSVFVPSSPPIRVVVPSFRLIPSGPPILPPGNLYGKAVSYKESI